MTVKQYYILPLFSFGIAACTCSSVNAAAESWSFDPALLGGEEGRNVDISVFNEGSQLPGIYPVDILLNGDVVDSREMVFHQARDKSGKRFLKTCLTEALLTQYGVKTEQYPGLFAARASEKTTDDETQQCAALTAIPQATETFQFYRQQLLLSVPQAALRPKVSGLAPQELWDDGIPALRMNYRINTARSTSSGSGSSTNSTIFAQLEPGANLGAWRLRNLTTWQKEGQSPEKWQTAWTYAERGLYGLKSRLALGDRYTPADIFDSIPFRGVMLGSDEAMVPYNQREFAPVIRGIAHTQARIEVKRSSYVIYSTTVAPGPFALTDLPSAGDGGDLQVTVFENDGHQQSFIVPSTTPAIALREGYFKYNLMSGRYRPSNGAVSDSYVAQASLMYGLPWGITAYGGLQGAAHYSAASLGLGVSLNRLGAISLDGIQEQRKPHRKAHAQGSAWRVRYSKNIEATNTGFTFSSYRYASSGFHGLSAVLDSDRAHDAGEYLNQNNLRRKTRSSLTLSQSLGQWGSVSLTGARESYWQQRGTRDELMVSWSTSFHDATCSLNWTQRQEPVYHSGAQPAGRKTDREVSFWISLPLDRWMGNHTRASYQMVNGDIRGAQHEMGLNGDSFDRRLSWDVRERMTPGNPATDRNSSLVNLTWRGAYGELKGGYRYSPSSRQMNAGLAGGVVIHRHGITLGQPLGETVALVEAPGAAGVSAGDIPGVKTDFRGYTTLDYVMPYQANLVTLDPNTLPADVEVPQTDTRIVPTAGAVIAAKFSTRTGARAVITLTQANNRLVPFGALVTLAGNETNTGAGITGDGGEVYMSGLPQTGRLLVSLGHERSCIADYRLPEEKSSAGIYALSAMCHSA